MEGAALTSFLIRLSVLTRSKLFEEQEKSVSSRHFSELGEV